MNLMFWKTSAPKAISAADLFGDGQSYVDGSPADGGFGDMYLPDRFRGIGSRAKCKCKVRSSKLLHPYLLIRATPSGGGNPPMLSVKLDGFELGAQRISQYGTYYFQVPGEILQRLKRDWANINLDVMGDAASKDGGQRIAVYEVRLIDAAADDFPDKQAFANKLSLFSPTGGIFFETLAKFDFKPDQRLLEIGAGEGHLACLVAAFSGASVTGIDVIRYDDAGVSTNQKLTEQLRLHRSLLLQTKGLQELGSEAGLSAVMARTRHISMDAEQMLWPDESFDFVYSLNVMEHIPNPERALGEIRRVLRPGGTALIQYSPLYYSDSGSHLPGTLGFNRPWAQLVMSRDEIKQAIVESGSICNEVDHILDSLNGHPPRYYRDAVERSGLSVVLHHSQCGFTVPGAEESSEYQQLLGSYSEEDLTTYGMCWVLRKAG